MTKHPETPSQSTNITYDKENPRMTTQPNTKLQRVHRAVGGVLVLGMAASVAANMLHADPNPISKVIAAWPPIALLLAIELVIHVPADRRWWVAWLRRIGTLSVACIAAYVSYWHMAGVAERYGEAGLSVYLLPLSVDGLIAVASICLVEISGRLRAEAQPELERPAEHPTQTAIELERPVQAAAPKPVRDKPRTYPPLRAIQPAADAQRISVRGAVRASADKHGHGEDAQEAVLADIRATHPDASAPTVLRYLRHIRAERQQVAADA